jgi:UDP-N-acetylglucosamine 2-epimerase
LDFNPTERYGGVGADLDPSSDYIVVMQHPVTTEYETSRSHIEETLYAVLDAGVPAYWFWPNVDAGSDGTSRGIRAFRERHHDAPIRYFKNMAPTDFLRLLVNGRGIVGNSSVAIREASFLAVPAVNIGSRQAGRERGGNVIDAAYQRAAIVQAIIHQADRYPPGRELLYGDGRAGERIASVLASAPLTIEKKLTY